MRVGIGFDSLLYFCNRVGSIQVHLSETQRAIHEVNVTISEAGQQEMLLSVDHLCVFATKGCELLFATDREYFVTANGYRVCRGLTRVDRPDLRIDDDDVGRGLRE